MVASRHILAALIFLIMVMSCSDDAQTQPVVSGQLSTAYADGESGASQYSINDGRGTFLWRGDLFADYLFSDNIAFLSNIRIEQDLTLRIDLFALRFSDIASSGLDLQVGQIDIPFGSLGERRFPKQNPFYRLPLTQEHLTTLCSSDYKVWVLAPSFAQRGDGVRVLDQGLYDLGVRMDGQLGMVDYALSLINGMMSATATYTPDGLNNNRGFGAIGRVGITPAPWMSAGVSYGAGSFMADQSADSASFLFESNPQSYPQKIIGSDISVSMGHFSFNGQAFYNIWVYQRDLKSFGYSAEFQYAVTPRMSIAARAGGLVFGEVEGLLVPSRTGERSFSGKWDSDVFRLESSIRYNLTRQALIKIVYEWNHTINVGEEPRDNLVVAQVVLSF